MATPQNDPPNEQEFEALPCLEHAPNREELFRTALESLAEGILITDRKSRIIYTNGRMTELTGYTPEEMIGKVSHHLLCPEEQWVTQDARLHRRLSGQQEQYELEVRRKDGSMLWMRVRATPYVDISGRVIGTVGAMMCIELERQLEAANATLLGELRGQAREMVGQSASLSKVLSQIRMVAPTDAAVLILGESGVGKELVARAIHEMSDRREMPMVRVNCASIPKELFESEFFGHVKGAFTGALRDRAGRFELAEGGTLFLDEIGEIPLDLQSKLLRVLQEGQFERVGEERTRRADVRIIAATNRELEAEAKAGRFRLDLYYRLSVFPVQVPPLRDRREDIPLLAQHFAAQSAKRLGMKVPRLTEAHHAELSQYPWPGNIRELQNVIERGVILSRTGPLRFDLPQLQALGTHLGQGQSPRSNPEGLLSVPNPAPSPPSVTPNFERLSDLKTAERDLTLTALKEAKGRIYGKGGAADRLGLPPTTLISRLKKQGIDPLEFKRER